MGRIIAALHHAIISFFLTESLAATGPNAAFSLRHYRPPRAAGIRPGCRPVVTEGRASSLRRRTASRRDRAPRASAASPHGAGRWMPPPRAGYGRGAAHTPRRILPGPAARRGPSRPRRPAPLGKPQRRRGSTNPAPPTPVRQRSPAHDALLAATRGSRPGAGRRKPPKGRDGRPATPSTEMKGRLPRPGRRAHGSGCRGAPSRGLRPSCGCGCAGGSPDQGRCPRPRPLRLSGPQNTEAGRPETSGGGRSEA